MEVAQDLLQLVHALSGLVSEETLANFVPVLLRDLALEAAILHLVQPCVYWGILLRIAEKTWWVLPGLENRLEVEFFLFECFKHVGIGDSARYTGSIELWGCCPFILCVLKYTSGMPHGEGVKPSHKQHSLVPDRRVLSLREKAGFRACAEQ